jgi:hypothetical protein
MIKQWKKVSSKDSDHPETYRLDLTDDFACVIDFYETSKIAKINFPCSKYFSDNATANTIAEAQVIAEQWIRTYLTQEKECSEQLLVKVNNALAALDEAPKIIEPRLPRKKGYYADFFPLFKIPECLLNWEDLSYHNDACPSNGLTIGDKYYFVWVDYEDKESRENSDYKRFSLCKAINEEYDVDYDIPGAVLLSTDSEEELERFIKENILKGEK